MVDKALIKQLAWGYVDGDARLRPPAMVPTRGVLHRRAEDPIVYFCNEARLFGDCQKIARLCQAPVRHPPAQKRFDQTHFRCGQIDLRLVGKLEFRRLQRAPQSLLYRKPSGGDFRQLRREDRELAAAQFLGTEQR